MLIAPVGATSSAVAAGFARADAGSWPALGGTKTGRPALPRRGGRCVAVRQSEPSGFRLRWRSLAQAVVASGTTARRNWCSSQEESSGRRASGDVPPSGTSHGHWRSGPISQLDESTYAWSRELASLQHQPIGEAHASRADNLKSLSSFDLVPPKNDTVDERIWTFDCVWSVTEERRFKVSGKFSM